MDLSRCASCQLGDAAHSFLPTSGSGAAMAMEDAYSLATCLRLGGKSDISLAVRVHNHLRFERVSCAQKMGFYHREKFHNTEWDEVARNPDVARLLRIGSCAMIRSNTSTTNTVAVQAISSGQRRSRTPICLPATDISLGLFRELMEASDRHEPIDEGDWS